VAVAWKGALRRWDRVPLRCPRPEARTVAGPLRGKPRRRSIDLRSALCTPGSSSGAFRRSAPSSESREEGKVPHNSFHFNLYGRVYPDKDKVTRASAAGALYKAGKIYHRRGAAWLHDFEAELLGFPAAEHDDQVDALAYAARDLSRMVAPQRRVRRQRRLARSRAASSPGISETACTKRHPGWDAWTVVSNFLVRRRGCSAAAAGSTGAAGGALKVNTSAEPVALCPPRW
jgi:hypothetical protein